MNNIENISLLADLIGVSNNIVLVGHLNPDGDSIGSLVGVRDYLRTLGKRAFAIVPNKFPDFLSFLDSNNDILVYSNKASEVESVVSNCDLIICLDFNSLHRIDAMGDLIAQTNVKKVLIDHHPQPDTIFDLIFSDPRMSSACELAYWIVKELLSGRRLPFSSAVAFYTGLTTDTNNFANSVIPSTFFMAAQLMQMGVDKEWVQSMIFGGFNESRMRLMGYMLLENMKIIPHLQAAIMVITKDIKAKFSFQDGDSEGFVNLALNIKGVKVSALFTEADEFVKVSLRSKGSFSVNRLARASFNGGGHERAAGGRLYIPISDVESYFVKSVGDFIEKEK